MSKELKWFKFTASEYLLGRIFDEKDSVKGIFTDACAYYWFKKCDVSRADLQKKLGKKRLEILLTKEYLHEINGFIVIPFLDEQRDELIDNHEFNSENGAKGAKKRWDKSDSPPITLREDIDKEEDKNKIREKWADPIFLELLKKWFSYKRKRRESYKSDESEKAFEKKLKRLSGGDVAIAEEIIDDSIASNYAGIFPLKRNISSGGGSGVKSTDKVATTLSQHEEAKNILHGKSGESK